MGLLTDTDGKVMPFVISSFRGGMRMDIDSTELAEGEYFLLINGRSRDGKLRPVKLPSKETSISGTRFQALFGTGATLIVIIDGKLLSKNFEGSDPNFARPPFDPMNEAVETIFGEFIPASNINFRRTLPPGAFDPRNDTIIFTDPVANSPRALLLQDTINQPRLIFPDGLSSRFTSNFAQWDHQNNREYVPKGRQMLYHNGKLYIVSLDGAELYHSVTGRPLDFVIAIQGEAGDKIVDNIYNEEAQRLSHKVSFEPITALSSLDIPTDDPSLDPPFYVGTKHNSFLIYPNVFETIFDEPTFRNVGIFPTGPINHNSFVEMDGDFGFISTNGIRSFNAIAQVKNEGKNSDFSLFVHPLFLNPTTGEYLEQNNTSSWNYDNYSLFAVNTIYGYGILVYDNLLGRHVALDIYPEINTPIKQFAEIIVNGRHRLFFITATGLYEAFAGATATMRCLIKEYSSGNMHIEHSIRKARIVLDSIMGAGNLTLTEYSDRKKGEVKTRTLAPNTEAIVLPMTPPYGVASRDTIREETFIFNNTRKGWKIGLEIALNAPADIVEFQLLPEVYTEENTFEQKTR